MKKELEKKYKGKKVLIWGLGLHGGGVGAAIFFAKLGAKVLVTDMKSEKELQVSIAKLKKFENISYRLGEHLEKDFIDSDFIIRNPAVKDDNLFLRIAERAGVKIENDIGIFFENSPAYIIGVTGTKGKSTVTAMLYDLISHEIRSKKNNFFKKFNKVFLGGNIRKSVFDCLNEANDKSIVVLELSSAQLHHASYTKKSPNVAIITNIYPEHISFHFTYDNYVEAKKNIYRFQEKDDLLIINKKLCKFVSDAKAKKVFFDGTNEGVLKEFAKYFEIDDLTWKRILKEFKGLGGRKELIAEINGRRFINDTCATHPSAVSFALEEFKKPVLILGGVDKMFGNGEIEELAKKIVMRGIKTVLLPGDFSDRIKQALSFDYKSKDLFEVSDMNDAVRKAYALSKKGDTILLSPGGASFNLFINEFDRGKKFVAVIKQIKKEQKNK